MLQCPVRVRASEGLNMALKFHNVWFLLPPVVTWAPDINTDSSCSRTTDPDMALSSNLGLDFTRSLWSGHPDRYGPSSSMALRHQHALRGLASDGLIGCMEFYLHCLVPIVTYFVFQYIVSLGESSIWYRVDGTFFCAWAKCSLNIFLGPLGL